MARWIKADGTVKEIQPANKTEFSLDEMRACVGGHIEAVKLTSQEVMYVNDEGVLQQLPINTTATEVLHQHRPDRAHEPICGDVLIASLVETGDEDPNLHIQTTPIDAACTECGKSPAIEWNMYGMTGILCQECLAKEVGNANLALQTGQFFSGLDFLEALKTENWGQTFILHTPTMEVKLEDNNLTLTLPDCEVELNAENTETLTRFLIDHVKLPPVEPIEDFPDDFQAKRVDTDQEQEQG
jgi:hypothetical protein